MLAMKRYFELIGMPSSSLPVCLHGRTQSGIAFTSLIFIGDPSRDGTGVRRCRGRRLCAEGERSRRELVMPGASPSIVSAALGACAALPEACAPWDICVPTLSHPAAGVQPRRE